MQKAKFVIEAICLLLLTILLSIIVSLRISEARKQVLVQPDSILPALLSQVTPDSEVVPTVDAEPREEVHKQEPVVQDKQDTRTPAAEPSDIQTLQEPTYDADTSTDISVATDAAADCAQNYDMIKRLCIAEAGVQGYEGMWRIAFVLYCRAYCTDISFGNGLYGVMTQPGQFTTPYSGDISKWDAEADRAVQDVFYNHIFPWDVPVHFFLIPSMVSQRTLNWFYSCTYIDTYGVHEFRSAYSQAELDEIRGTL